MQTEQLLTELDGLGKIRLIIFDVDGTLMDSDHHLRDGVSSTIESASKDGLQITIASGRNQRQIHALAKDLKIHAPVISLGGACISSPLEDQPTWHQTFPIDLVHELVPQARAADLAIMMQMLGENRLEANAVIRKEIYAIADGDITFVEDILEKKPSLPSKLTFIGDVDSISLFQTSLKSKPVCASLSGQRYLDVTPEAADKGAAVRRLLKYLNLDPTEVAAVGDGHNDISMFREVMLPIAMGNALEEVQQSATLTAPSNDQEGASWAVNLIQAHNLKY